MKTASIAAFLGLVVLMLTACGTPEKTIDPGTGAGVTKPGTAAETADAVFALDNKANAAYLRSDSKFFEKMLSDKFVMREAGRQMDKAAAVKLIAGNKCNVKGWKLEDPKMARIDAGVYVLSYRGTFDGSCAGPDGTLKIASPIRAATVWIRAGGAWRAAFHGQDPILDTENPPPPAKAEAKKEAKKDDKAVPIANITTDPNTAAMMAVEKNVWEAWKAKDAKKLDELTTADLSFQNIFGAYFANKADTLKNWTSAYCDIKSVSVADGEGRMLSPNVGILNRTGTAGGTCNGQNLPPVPIYGSSVYVREGETWKLAFSLNRLD